MLYRTEAWARRAAPPMRVAGPRFLLGRPQDGELSGILESQ
jgi:hypothetical protein